MLLKVYYLSVSAVAACKFYDPQWTFYENKDESFDEQQIVSIVIS